MATKSADSILHESVGSMYLRIKTFSDIDRSDVDTSNVTGEIGFWGTCTDIPTAISNNGADIGADSSEDVIFYPAEDNRAMKLCILSTGVQES